VRHLDLLDAVVAGLSWSDTRLAQQVGADNHTVRRWRSSGVPNSYLPALRSLRDATAKRGIDRVDLAPLLPWGSRCRLEQAQKAARSGRRSHAGWLSWTGSRPGSAGPITICPTPSEPGRALSPATGAMRCRPARSSGYGRGTSCPRPRWFLSAGRYPKRRPTGRPASAKGNDGLAFVSGVPAVGVVGCNPVPGGFGIYNWNGTDWEQQPGGAMRIGVDLDGNAWVVNNVGQIYSS
jgi:hypothetical protein